MPMNCYMHSRGRPCPRHCTGGKQAGVYTLSSPGRACGGHFPPLDLSNLLESESPKATAALLRRRTKPPSLPVKSGQRAGAAADAGSVRPSQTQSWRGAPLTIDGLHAHNPPLHTSPPHTTTAFHYNHQPSKNQPCASTASRSRSRRRPSRWPKR